MKIDATTVLVACWAALAPCSSAADLPEWPAASNDGPLLILAKDGTAVEGLGPVTGDERTLRFRLAGGQLVSINRETVEQITLPPRPAASVVPGRGAAARPASSQASRVERYTNEDLSEIFGTTDLPAIPASADAPSAAGSTVSMTDESTPSTTMFRDRDGHDEAWWRARVEALHGDLAATQADIERLEKEYRVAKAIVSAPMPRSAGGYPARPGPLPGRGRARVSSQEAVNLATFEEKRDELAALRARETELRAEIDGLPNETRLVGALPGWIR